MKLAALALLAVAVPALAAPVDTITAAHPEARPFGKPEDAARQIDQALTAAATKGRRVILVFGANWCYDSRALAGWFATPRFTAMLRDRYEIVWINVGDAPGEKDRNLDLARRFGLDGIKGTPTVLVTDASGKPLNLGDAPSWRNASTRSEQSIFAYFDRLKPGA